MKKHRKENCAKLKNSNCEKKNSKTQIVTVVIVTIVTIAVVTVVIVTYLIKNQLGASTTYEMFSGQLFAILAMFLFHLDTYGTASASTKYELNRRRVQ